MSRVFLSAALLACASLSSSPLLAQKGPDAAFRELDAEEKEANKAPKTTGNKTFDAFSQSYEDGWTKLSAAMEAMYREQDRQIVEAQRKLQQQVHQKWTEFHPSTNKTWVDYSPKAGAMSKVDFEKGEVEVEVLVPVEEVAPKKKTADFSELDEKEQAKLKALAEGKLKAQTRKMVAEKEQGKAEVLKDQLQTPEGKPVTEKNADKFVKEVVAPKMTVEEKPVVAEDGKPRLKVKVKIGLVPDHLKVRAKRYSSQVHAAAERYGLDPALIYALMHTESEFNPKARSVAGAFGLMQIVPRTAGVEAYKFLYNQEKLVTPEYLFEPDNNIALGTAYLHMLHTRHYGKVQDPDNRRSLSIAAYNCGPGNVRKLITNKHPVDGVPNAEVVRLITTLAPKETQAYVPRVEGRMGSYRGL
ncbi:MAG: transglycosylase SLT domain-containing protein [Elusimicrobia bacterium]|nr:transglycosylase SLT domain-containing protein [Elusimicrobiota bacterium]